MPETAATYLFAGGGTGGHLFPGIAVAEELQHESPGARCVFVGSGRTLEQPLVSKRGFEYATIPAEPWRQLFRNPLRFAWRNWKALQAAKQLLREHQPRAVIGLGGYASAPLVWAAGQTGIPTVLLEQNSVPGRANRWLSRRADLVCLSYAESVAGFRRSTKTVLTGNPLRRELCQWPLAREEPTRPTLLILGGSQGAQPLNAAVPFAIAELQPLLHGWVVRHQVGTGHVAEWQAVYAREQLQVEVVDFISDMRAAYAEATIVVSRAGATTLAELACAGLPSILVPYPQATENHQRKNAEALMQAGAAEMVPQHADPQLTAAQLTLVLKQWLVDPQPRYRLSYAIRRLARPHAAAEVCRHLRELCATP